MQPILALKVKVKELFLFRFYSHTRHTTTKLHHILKTSFQVVGNFLVKNTCINSTHLARLYDIAIDLHQLLISNFSAFMHS